jgi:hypothetical protein
MFEIYASHFWSGLVKDYLKPEGKFLVSVKFDYLFNEDVRDFFMHKWNHCLGTKCAECRKIVDKINSVINARRKVVRVHHP